MESSSPEICMIIHRFICSWNWAKIEEAIPHVLQKLLPIANNVAIHLKISIIHLIWIAFVHIEYKNMYRIGIILT